MAKILCILGNKFRGMEKVSPALRAPSQAHTRKGPLDETGEEKSSKKWELGNALKFSDISCSVVPSWVAVSVQEGIFPSLESIFHALQPGAVVT